VPSFTVPFAAAVEAADAAESAAEAAESAGCGGPRYKRYCFAASAALSEAQQNDDE
jgi:hypothetical protein